MSTIAAAPPTEISTAAKAPRLPGLLKQPAVIPAVLSVVGALLVAFLGPWVARGVQNHEKSL